LPWNLPAFAAWKNDFHFTDHDQYDRAMEKLSDLHIYTGSKCNRQCDFCIVSGRPDGWYEPITGAPRNCAALFA
jgi:hypothetical protein